MAINIHPIPPTTLTSLTRKTFCWFTATRRRKILSITLISLITLTSLRFLFFQPKEVKAADVYLTFDEGYGTSSAVHDTNSTVSAGSITNAVWKTEDLCRFGKCLYFDGTGDYVSFGDDANLDMAAANTVTVELWFRTPDITSGTRTLISKYETGGAPTDGGYEITINSGGQIVFGIDSDDTSFPVYSVTSASAYDDNKWHYVAAVKDGTSSMTLYLDGATVGNTSIVSTDASNDDPVYIGSHFEDSTATNGFSGFIDEVKVLRTARTATEIKADFTGETPSRGTSASFTPNQSYLSNGLIGYWKMDDNVSGDQTIAESSGNGNNGVSENGANGTGMDCTYPGKFGTACDFDGTDDYILVSNESIYEIPSKTVAFWAYVDATIVNSEIVVGTRAANWYTGFQQGTNKMLTSHNTAAEAQQTSSAQNTAAVGSWRHYTYIFDVKNSNVNISYYTNGQYVETDSYTTGYGTTYGSDMLIGALTQSVSFYDGKVDELRIYNRSLSPTEVSQLYNWAPGPVVHWKFDENTGTTMGDSSGNGNDGAFISAVSDWITGKYGSALYFNGTDANPEGVYKNTTTAITAYPFTISGWVKHSISTANVHTITLGDKDDQYVVYGISTDNGGDPRIYIATGGSVCTATAANTNTSDNQWHYLSAIFISSTSRSMYIDGKFDHSDSTSCSYSAAVDRIAAGMPPAGAFTSDFYPGIIDDVKIYNYVRTPAQIIEDMNAGHPAPGSPIGSAVAYWAFDEGSLNTCSGGANDFCDSSTNTNDLVFSTTTGGFTNLGKFGKAFNGDGTVWASRTNDADLDFSATEDFTISTWIKSDSATNPANGTEYILATTTGNTDAGYAIYANTDGTICFGIDDDATWGPDVASCTTSDYYDGNWHHVTAVRNVTLDKTYIYIDSLEKDSDTDTTTATLDGDNVFYLGDFDGDDNATSGIEEFAGDIDETKIFRSALTANQVKLLYSQSSAAVWGAASTDSSGNASWSSTDSYCPPGQGSACVGPVLEWKLDENTGTTSVFDTSGNGYTGSLQGAMTENNWVKGKYGSGLNFDGTDDYVKNSTRIISGYPFTLEGWIKTTGTNNGAIVALTDSASSRVTYRIQTSDSSNTVRYRLDDGTNTAGTGATTNTDDDNWHYIVGVFDGTTAKVYVDGVLEIYHTPSYPSYTAGVNTVSIGGEDHTVDGSFINKHIDHARVYDYARTPAQVAWSFNRGAPIAHYQLDECSGASANNSSPWTGNDPGLDGTISAGSGGGNTSVGSCSVVDTATMWYNGRNGKRNGSLDFDGDATAANADRVEVSDTESLDFTYTVPTPDIGLDFSLEAWINRATFTADNTIIAKKNDQTTGAGYIIYIDDTNDDINFVAADGTDSFSINGLTSITSSGWHHIVVVFDADSATGSTIYLDGMLDKQSDSGTIGNVDGYDNALALQIGGESDEGNSFDGQIDEVKIWNYALNATQVKNEYAGGTVRFGN